MKLPAVMLLAACGGGGIDHDVIASMRFDVTRVEGRGPSPLDPLGNQTIDLEIALDDVGVFRAETPTCKELVLFVDEATRTASGATADLVEREIFDVLVGWDIDFTLCDDPALSTIVVEAAINELNVGFGCTDIPAAAQVRDADGFPLLTRFTARACSATILDVVNNRDLGADGFTIELNTGPAQVP